MKMEEPNYDLCTDAEFDRYLATIVDEEVQTGGAEALLTIPGVYEIIREHFNNEVLERWANDHPEAWPEGENDEDN